MKLILIYFEKSYYMVPAAGGEHAYSLLREALAGSKSGGVGTFTLRNVEYIGIIGVHGDILLLYQLRFNSEIIPRSNVPTPPLPKPSPAEVDMFTAIINKFKAQLYIADYHNSYSERIYNIAEQKIKSLKMNKQVVPPTQATSENDILTALRETLVSATSLNT